MMDILEITELLDAEEDIDEECAAYIRTNIARDEELIGFVDEFLNSEEFFLIQQSKCVEETKTEVTVSSSSECICVECWAESKEVKLSKAALVKRAQKLWAMEQRFENHVKNKAIQGIIKHQKKSICIIRKKIAEAKQRYICHKEEREQLVEKHREEVLEELKNKYKVNTQYIKTKSKPVDKVLVYNKIRLVQRNKRRSRMVAIISKILAEYRRQRQIDDLKNRRYDTKVVRKEKVLKDIEVLGTSIELLPTSEPKPEEIIIDKEEKLDVPAPEAPKTDKDKKKKKGKDKKDKASGKSDKASKKGKDKLPKPHKKEKSDKKSKQVKDGSEKPVELVLPYVPITNKRLKIKVDAKQNMGDLIADFMALEPLVEEREKYNQHKELLQGVFYPTDITFTWSPKTVEFQGYKNGVTYKKKINILNGGSIKKKCRFYFLKLDEFNPTLFQVEPVGAQHLIPGFSLAITITFIPTTLERIVQGEIVFLTYQSNRNEYMQVNVPLVCIPWCSNISIAPATVIFGSLPLWEAKQMAQYKNFKTLKISNVGKKTCKIAITKMRDPFHLHDIPALEGCQQTPSVEDTYEITFVKEKEDHEANARFHFDESEGYELFVPLDDTELMMKETMEQCVDDVFNAFTFKCYCFNVEPSSDKKIRVYFRNVDYVGHYCEKYLISVFEQFDDNVLNCVGSQEITIQAETTGHFIEVTPETLDFNVCVFDSVYQLSFIVHNTATIAHGVGVKFPSCLKRYLSSSENDVYIQPHGYKRISIKFIPRKQITLNDKVKYYNPETNILEFPIYINLMSKQFSSIPPSKIIIYAILTNSNGLSIKPVQWKHTSYINDTCEIEMGLCNCDLTADYAIDMGACTIAETVYTELELINHSYVFQVYGFLNLPECIKILPNYGFGEILPLETKKLTLAFTPEARDIPNYALECEQANHTITFKITLDTIKSVGRLKKSAKPFNYKYIRTSLETTEKELEREFPLSLVQDMYAFLDLFQDGEVIETLLFDNRKKYEENASQSETNTEMSRLDRTPVSDDICPEEEVSELFNIISNKLWIKATIVDPLCDISHQYIEFPDTPCGSYSFMSTDLRGLSKLGDFDCSCGYSKKFSKCKKNLQYSAHYEIVGDNSQINIEPICGDLQNGQTVKLTLVAQPQLSEGTVMAAAKEIKRGQLLQRKRQEWEIKRQKELAAKLAKAAQTKDKKGRSDKGKGKGKKEAKGKKQKPSEKPDAKAPLEPEPIPEFVVEDHELVVDYLDLCPAEMVAWKNMEFYFIEANFCCTVTYSSDQFLRKPEKLYFTAVCKVIKPVFIHNLKTQHIDFGPTVMGMISRKIISVQNIHCAAIDPQVTMLSPTGFFTCPSSKNIQLPPEHLLQLPITFAPSADQEAIEYFEIRAGETICPFIVSGKGVGRNFTISPDFVVCRLEANRGAFADCSIEINNQCEAPLIINFVKICELEGEVKPIEAPKAEAAAGKAPKPVKGAKKGKDKKEKPKKVNKFSPDLTKEEEVSLQNYFCTKEGESYFEILGGTSGEVLVDKLTKKAVKIRFGVPLPPSEDEKGKKGKKAKKAPKGSSKSSKGTKLTGPKKYYVAKYNIMLGNSTFLRDAIIIATFI